MLRRFIVVLVVVAAAACGQAAEDEHSTEVGTLDDVGAPDVPTASEPAEPSPSPRDTASPSPTDEASPIGPDDDGAQADPDDDSTSGQDLSEQRGFEMPSGNIACLAADYGAGPYLQCEMLSQLDPPPDEVCDFDWSGINMWGTGPAEPLCASDTMRGELDPEPYVLPYGEVWTAGPFTCTSERTGLTCTNDDDGRLFLSRARWEAS